VYQGLWFEFLDCRLDRLEFLEREQACQVQLLDCQEWLMGSQVQGLMCLEKEQVRQTMVHWVSLERELHCLGWLLASLQKATTRCFPSGQVHSSQGLQQRVATASQTSQERPCHLQLEHWPGHWQTHRLQRVHWVATCWVYWPPCPRVMNCPALAANSRAAAR
jgi:hypothetical protein